MNKSNTKLFIGMDVSEEKIEIFILEEEKAEGIHKQVCNDSVSINKFLDAFKDTSSIAVALETGTHSPWLSDLIEARGCKTYVANARKLRMIWGSDNKSDKRDAEVLARAVRHDTNLLKPIKHRGKPSRIALSVVRSRDVLVRSRTTLMNSVRGQLSSFGVSTKILKPSSFTQAAYKILPTELVDALSGLLNQIRLLELEIKQYDKKISKLCKQYSDTQKLRQIKGVGELVALTYILTIDDPGRFMKGNRISSYLGLVPRRQQSGEMDKQMNITKAGDTLLRRLLIQSANYILGPFGEDCDLRNFGMKIMSRGGKIARKKAKVAVARKLSILLHKLWTTDEKYDRKYKKSKKDNRKKLVA